MSFSPVGKRAAISQAIVSAVAVNEVLVDTVTPGSSGWRGVNGGSKWYLLVTAPSGSAPSLLESSDKGATWIVSPLTTGAAAKLPLFDAAFRPSDHAPIFASADGAAPGFPVGSPNTGAWSSARARWIAPASLALVVGLDALGAPRLVVTDGSSTVVDRSAQIPAGAFTGATEWFIATASPTAGPLVVASNANDRVLVSADASTYAAHAIGLDAGYALKGLASNTAGFTAIASNGSSTKLYTSPDGAAWTLAMTLAGTPSTVGAPDFANVAVSANHQVL